MSKEGNYPPQYPWHLADIWWYSDTITKNFESLSLNFQIKGNLKDVCLYIAPIGLGQINNIKFYGGVQTNGQGHLSKTNNNIERIGFNGIFSRWSNNNKPISLDFAKTHINTYYESAEYEGEFVSVRKKIDWEEGAYTFITRKQETVKENGILYTWFGAFLYCHTKELESYIGSLKFEGEKFTYWNKHAAFVEIYSCGIKSEIPHINVQFDAPKINNEYRTNKKIVVNYPNDIVNNKYRYSYSKCIKDKILITTIPRGIEDGMITEQY